MRVRHDKLRSSKARGPKPKYLRTERVREQRAEAKGESRDPGLFGLPLGPSGYTANTLGSDLESHSSWSPLWAPHAVTT